MSEPTTMRLTTNDGVRVELTRCPTPPAPSCVERRPVLLLHGASASSNTFTTPGGGLTGWLAENGFAPWLLDWRGSGALVAGKVNAHLLVAAGTKFNFNAAAENDITAALRHIHSTSGSPISVIGFCMGAGILAEAIAAGFVNSEGSGPRVNCVVLMTLGLFYETPMDGRLKSEERILERLKGTRIDEVPFHAIDPRVKSSDGGAAGSGTASTDENALQLENRWPEELEKVYGTWPGRLKSHAEKKRPPVHEMCNRLCFLYGTPYYHPNLVPEIHGEGGSQPLLPDRFGAIPLDMFIHAARNVRRGQATLYERSQSSAGNRSLVSDDSVKPFADLQKVTLITGDRNQLWHRDSIDRMYEWLSRAMPRGKLIKYVIPGYGHQDLLWGRTAQQDVYTRIREGLRG